MSVAGGGGVRRRCLPTKEIKVAGQGEVTVTAKQGTGQMRTNKLGPLKVCLVVEKLLHKNRLNIFTSI